MKCHKQKIIINTYAEFIFTQKLLKESMDHQYWIQSLKIIYWIQYLKNL